MPTALTQENGYTEADEAKPFNAGMSEIQMSASVRGGMEISQRTNNGLLGKEESKEGELLEESMITPYTKMGEI